MWAMCPFHMVVVVKQTTDTFTSCFTSLPSLLRAFFVLFLLSLSSSSNHKKIFPPRSSSSYVHLHTHIHGHPSNKHHQHQHFYIRRCPSKPRGASHTLHNTHTQPATENQHQAEPSSINTYTQLPSSLRPSFWPPPSPPQDKHAGIIKVRHVSLCVCVWYV